MTIPDYPPVICNSRPLSVIPPSHICHSVAQRRNLLLPPSDALQSGKSHLFHREFLDTHDKIKDREQRSAASCLALFSPFESVADKVATH